MRNLDAPELISVLRRYSNANVSVNDWPKPLVKELNHPDFPDRAQKFQSQLRNAILNRTISPLEYEKLTEEDLETPEEVESSLRELWQDLYGELDVALSN
jgi:hypothetical protein